MRREVDVTSKLERWLGIGERDAPVAFVGREDEIDLAISQLATWRAGSSRGRTVVAQGAPGAGKTSLLGEIARRLPSAIPNAVSIYLPTPWTDEDVPYVVEELAVQLMALPSDVFHTTRSTETTAGVSAVATAHRGETRSVTPPRLKTWNALWRHFGSRAHQSRPTLLLLDEVQRMGSGEAVRDLLYHLHDQTTFPVVLVCGGLSTSAAHILELGLSRVAQSNVLGVDALGLAEAERCLDESLRMMADEVGIEGHPDQWARQLAPQTHGWPQHITCHIRAAATALRASGRLAFDDANLQEARRDAAANIRYYYEQRLETSRTDAAIVFAVHEAIKGGKAYAADAADVVDGMARRLSGSRRSRHEAGFRDPMQCVQQMLHAGVIAYAGKTTTSPLHIPIPSMATHIAGMLSDEQRAQVHETLAKH